VGSVVPDVSKDRSDTNRFLQQRKSEEHLPSSIIVCLQEVTYACEPDRSVTELTDFVPRRSADDSRRALSATREIRDDLHSCGVFSK